jgi:Putative Actinobacterial Holin-X, holin superfamily III
MEHAARETGPQPVQERSAGELVKLLSEQVSLIVRDELRLAELEMKRKGKQAGSGAGMLGGGGLVALYGVGCLLASAIIAISGVIAAWLAALIIGSALLAVAAFAALVGKGRMRRAAPPVPREAAASVRADFEEIKERARQ